MTWSKKSGTGSNVQAGSTNGHILVNGQDITVYDDTTVKGLIATNNITTDTSGFFFQRSNLHDTSRESSGYINTSDGTISSSTTYTVSDYLPVVANTAYTSSFATTIATYDSNKVFKGMINTTASDTTSFNAPRQFTIPSGIAYVRYTRGNANTNPMFVRGSVLPMQYLPPGVNQLWVSQNSYVQSMNLQMNPLYGKTWNVLGDSVTNGGYTDTNTNTTVQTYHQIIASQYGLNVNNYGIGGTLITATADSQGFVQRYTSMTNTADIITVFGGINDYANAATTPIGTFGSTDTSTIYGAMDALCKGLLQKYPTQKLGFIIPYPFNEYKGSGTWKPYQDAMVQVLNYYSIPYLDLNKNSRLNANIDFINTTYFKGGDKTHPNTNGHTILASKIYAFLLSL